jgi:hypothetical protein
MPNLCDQVELADRAAASTGPLSAREEELALSLSGLGQALSTATIEEVA